MTTRLLPLPKSYEATFSVATHYQLEELQAAWREIVSGKPGPSNAEKAPGSTHWWLFLSPIVCSTTARFLSALAQSMAPGSSCFERSNSR